MTSYYVLDTKKIKIPIGNFMTTNIKSIQADVSVKEAATIMYENHIPSLLVEERDYIIGIVTYGDIALGLTVYDDKPTSQIREIMSSPVISVTSDSSILDAVELMLAKKIHKLPVIDNGKLQGVISSSDLMVLLSMLNEGQFYEVFRGQLSNER